MDAATLVASEFVPERSPLRELIERAKAGDISSFEALVSLHERRILRLAQRLLLNREAAQDAAQEVLIRLHAKLASFKEENEFQPWLYRMTVNICHDIRRRAKPALSLEEVDILPGAVNVRDNPEAALFEHEKREMVIGGLRQLSARERDVIVLRDLEGFTTAEVAHLLHSTEATVRSQISTGRVKLKHFIARRLRRKA